MFVLIAGGEPVGLQLAKFLLAQHNEVCLIENRQAVIERIHHKLPTEVVIEGFVTDLDLLERAGIRRANVIVACTPNDAENLALCYIARTYYEVPRTIGRINDPGHAWLFDKTFHVNVALNEATILAHLIEEEMSLGDMMTLLKLTRGKYSLVEVRIPAGTDAVGVAIKDLAMPDQCIIAAIFRRGEMIVPRGGTTFEVGDEVLAVTNAEGAEELAALFEV